ncbi:hypothetical protein KCP73_17690 [Salmonella enterica subsp. enterica]|nr:hypothetical protein KCP73_17690 [Salmonella enterica subsp. enterica]
MEQESLRPLASKLSPPIKAKTTVAIVSLSTTKATGAGNQLTAVVHTLGVAAGSVLQTAHNITPPTKCQFGSLKNTVHW